MPQPPRRTVGEKLKPFLPLIAQLRSDGLSLRTIALCVAPAAQIPHVIAHLALAEWSVSGMFASSHGARRVDVVSEAARIVHNYRRGRCSEVACIATATAVAPIYDAAMRKYDQLMDEMYHRDSADRFDDAA